MRHKSVFLKKIRSVDEIIEKQKVDDQILELIKDPNVEKYFFKKISQRKWFTLDWFPFLKEKSFFNPKNVPSFEKDEEGYYFPIWNELYYLEKISNILKFPKNRKYIDDLINIVKIVSKFVNSNGKKIDNFRIWEFFIKIISNLPNNKIDESVINLIPIWLDSKFDNTLQISEIIKRLLPKFLNEKSNEEDIKKAEKIIMYITEMKEVEVSETDKKYFGYEKRHKFKADIYWLDKYLQKNASLIAQKCSNKVIEDFENKLIKMLGKYEYQSYMSIYNEKRISEPFDLFSESLKNILNEKTNQKPNETKDILKRYLKSDFYLLQKIALYVLAHNVDNLNEFIFRNIDLIIGDSFKRQILVGDELKRLLNNIKKLTESEKKELERIIEEGPTKELPKEEEKQKVLIWRQRLYQALSHNLKFKQKYEEIKKQTDVDAELSPAVTFFSGWRGADKSPLSKEEIFVMKNADLASYLKSFKEEKGWEGSTIDGLTRVLQDAVKEKPDKFVYDLKPFIRSGYIYVYHILWGLRDVWKEKKSFDWEKLFDFIEDYIGQKGFWEGKLEVKFYHWDAKYTWVLTQIGELVQEGTKNDEWAVKEDLLPKAEIILIKIKNKLFEYQVEKEEDIDDPITYALNSVWGNIVTAMLFLALRKARIKEDTQKSKKSEVRWSNKIKEFFEKVMNKDIPESFTIFGQYFPNFIYLDRKWSFDRAKELEKRVDQNWENFFTGYLYWGKVYLDIFERMRGHYDRGLEYKFRNRTARERFVQHLAILFLGSKLDLNDESLIIQFIDREKSDDMEFFINFLRNQYQSKIEGRGSFKEINKDIIAQEREKVLKLWEYLYKKYSCIDNLNEDQKKIVSSLIKFTIFVRELNNKKVDFINLSISNLKKFYDVHLFIDDLIRIKNEKSDKETARYIGIIMLKLLEMITPSTFKENIKELVKFLYSYSTEDNTIKNSADKICNIYAEQQVYDEEGNLFLRDLYDKYN